MPDEHPLVAAYRAFSPASEVLAERAQAVFPGGDTRSSAHYVARLSQIEGLVFQRVREGTRRNHFNFTVQIDEEALGDIQRAIDFLGRLAEEHRIH